VFRRQAGCSVPVASPPLVRGVASRHGECMMREWRWPVGHNEGAGLRQDIFPSSDWGAINRAQRERPLGHVESTRQGRLWMLALAVPACPDMRCTFGRQWSRGSSGRKRKAKAHRDASIRQGVSGIRGRLSVEHWWPLTYTIDRHPPNAHEGSQAGPETRFSLSAWTPAPAAPGPAEEGRPCRHRPAGRSASLRRAMGPCSSPPR